MGLRGQDNSVKQHSSSAFCTHWCHLLQYDSSQPTCRFEEYHLPHPQHVCIYGAEIILRMCKIFNPHPAGGQKLPPPLPDFIDSSQTVADINAKLSVSSPTSIWCLPPKFQRNQLRKFWENGILLTLCFAILNKKTANLSTLLDCSVLK